VSTRQAVYPKAETSPQRKSYKSPAVLYHAVLAGDVLVLFAAAVVGESLSRQIFPDQQVTAGILTVTMLAAICVYILLCSGESRRSEGNRKPSSAALNWTLALAESKPLALTI
jgi:hypothetical protein